MNGATKGRSLTGAELAARGVPTRIGQPGGPKPGHGRYPAPRRLIGQLVRQEITEAEAIKIVRNGLQRALDGDIAWANLLISAGGEAFYAAKESEGPSMAELLILLQGMTLEELRARRAVLELAEKSTAEADIIDAE